MLHVLTYINSVNTWASGDSPLAQLVKELDLCVIQSLWDRLPEEPINYNNRSSHYSINEVSECMVSCRHNPESQRALNS